MAALVGAGVVGQGRRAGLQRGITEANARTSIPHQPAPRLPSYAHPARQPAQVCPRDPPPAGACPARGRGAFEGHRRDLPRSRAKNPGRDILDRLAPACKSAPRQGRCRPGPAPGARSGVNDLAACQFVKIAFPPRSPRLAGIGIGRPKHRRAGLDIGGARYGGHRRPRGLGRLHPGSGDKVPNGRRPPFQSSLS